MYKSILIGAIFTMSHAHEYTNHLIHEDSPYLQQHAHNPVNWYPWGEKAFEKAKKEDKLIFLSIGYSTCHWCHVMEREAFENKKIAKYMNKHYVNIKVDREELPHIDRYYQDLYMLLNKRSGGWPLSIIMTPDRKPFFAATYMPPENRHGRPGLLGMAQYLYETYRDKKENVYKSANSIESAMKSLSGKKGRVEIENKEGGETASSFVKGVEKLYDSLWYGIGTEPKFPHATTLDTLLSIYALNGDRKALTMVLQTLEAMAKGGIYDQIEGGFYRYSVDEKWMIPHFEKMLYTNAELIETYTHAWQLTKNPLFAKIVQESIHNIDERFLKEKLYFSASDADSDGEEGKYFVFEYTKAKEALAKAGFDKKEIKTILDYFHITLSGNFEGLNNSFLGEASPPENLKKAKAVLYALRKEKNYPFIDYKIQTSWNSLYIDALLKASVIDPLYQKAALASLDQLVEKLWLKGELFHQVVLPNLPKVKAYLEDYAFLTAALITANQLTYEEKYAVLAEELIYKAIANFYRDGIWYMSDDDFRSEASAYDSSYRSALAVMLENIMKMANLKEDQKLYAFAEERLKEAAAEMFSSPQNFPTLVKGWLGYTYGWVLLKGEKSALLQNRLKIAEITYPFVLSKTISQETFLACKIDRCFAFDKKIENVISQIK